MPVEQKSFAEHQPGGTLYLVPTPIGNLEDMTFRAINTLKEVDIILAEDTRQTGKLLNHFEIETRMLSFHDHSKSEEVERFVDWLSQGQSLALVSDAGMPLINDPGHPLVQRALEESLSVVSLPGANAALTALVASGLPAHRFAYYGFFPRTAKEQQTILQEIQLRGETAIFYESPYRIQKALEKIQDQLGTQTPVVVGRELTKRFETYLRGSVGELLEFLKDQTIKGEIVLLIYCEPGQVSSNGDPEVAELPLKDQVQALMDKNNLSPKEAIKQVAAARQIKKQIVYAAYHDLDNQDQGVD